MTHIMRSVPRLAAALALALSVLTLPVLVAPTALAADNGSWSVTPKPRGKTNPTPRNYFILEGAPGDVIKDKVRIQNRTDKPIGFRLYGADGFNTPQDGFFALREQDDDQVGVGAWLTPASSTVNIYGGYQTDVPITIRIPKNATPGDHVGGVVAMNVAVESTNEGASLDVGIQRAVAARVYLRVSGTTSPGFEVSDVNVTHDRGGLPWGGRGAGTVSYTVQNTGNVRLSPKGSVKVSGLFSHKATHDVGLDELLPGQKVILTQKISGIPSAGRLEVTVDLNAGEDLGSTADVTETLVPWPFIVLLLILLGGLVFWVKRRSDVLRRKLKDAEVAPKITVNAGETRG